MKLPTPKENPKKDWIFLNFRLEPKLHTKVQKLAKKQGFKTVSAFIRAVLEELPE